MVAETPIKNPMQRHMLFAISACVFNTGDRRRRPQSGRQSGVERNKSVIG